MIAPVQALRFLAAFWVVLFHARAPVYAPEALPALGAGWQAIASMGFAGVDIFFVISGAIMAEATARETGAARPGRFLWHRLARIYSGWWPFFVLYVLGLLAWRGTLAGKDLVASFTLWPAAPASYVLPIVWTLSFELYFYALLAALLALVPRARVGLALGAWGAVVALYLVAQWRLGHFRPENEAGLGLVDVFLLSPLVLEFVAGFLLREAFRVRPRGHWLAWTAAGAAFAVAGSLYHHHATLARDGLAGWFHAPERVLLLGTMGVCFVAAALRAPWRDRPALGALARLGDASYSLYLCHILVLAVLSHAWVALGVAAGWKLPAFGLALLAPCAYAWLHYRIVERPLYRLARTIAP